MSYAGPFPLPGLFRVHRTHFLDKERRVLPVQHCVTIRTNRNEVGLRIQDIFLSDRRERHEVMNLNEASAD